MKNFMPCLWQHILKGMPHLSSSSIALEMHQVSIEFLHATPECLDAHFARFAHCSQLLKKIMMIVSSGMSWDKLMNAQIKSCSAQWQDHCDPTGFDPKLRAVQQKDCVETAQKVTHQCVHSKPPCNVWWPQTFNNVEDTSDSKTGM